MQGTEVVVQVTIDARAMFACQISLGGLLDGSLSN